MKNYIMAHLKERSRDVKGKQKQQKVGNNSLNEILSKKSNNIFEKWYYIATYVLAGIAVLGFVWSIYTSYKSSETINSFVKGFTSFVEPVLKLSGIEFNPTPQYLNCENPPEHINFLYQNNSNIPIKVDLKSFNAFIGDIPVHQGTKKTIITSKQIVLAPGEKTGYTLGIDQIARNMMVNKVDMYNTPYFIVELTATISTLDDLKSYNILLKNFIGFDCRDYGRINITFQETNYDKVKIK